MYRVFIFCCVVNGTMMRQELLLLAVLLLFSIVATTTTAWGIAPFHYGKQRSGVMSNVIGDGGGVDGTASVVQNIEQSSLSHIFPNDENGLLVSKNEHDGLYSKVDDDDEDDDDEYTIFRESDYNNAESGWEVRLSRIDHTSPPSLIDDSSRSASATQFINSGDFSISSSPKVRIEPTTTTTPAPSSLSRHQHDDSYAVDSQTSYINDKVHISYTDAGTLQLDWYATGLTSQSVAAGAFSVAWFAALVPATTTLAVVPFLLPFYVAGGLVAKQAIVDPFTTQSLSIGRYAWSLTKSRFHANRKAKKNKVTRKEVLSGPTRQLQCVAVVERRQVIESNNHNHDNNRRQDTWESNRRSSSTIRYQYWYELQLVFQEHGAQKLRTIGGVSFGNRDEATQLAALLNEHVVKMHDWAKQESNNRDGGKRAW